MGLQAFRLEQKVELGGVEFKIVHLAVKEARFDEHLSSIVPGGQARAQPERRQIRPELFQPIGDGLETDPETVAPEDEFPHVFQGVKTIVESERVKDQLQRVNVMFVDERGEPPLAALALIELDGLVLLPALPFFDEFAASAKGTDHGRLGFGQGPFPDGRPLSGLSFGDGLGHRNYRLRFRGRSRELEKSGGQVAQIGDPSIRAEISTG